MSLWRSSPLPVLIICFTLCKVRLAVKFIWKTRPTTFLPLFKMKSNYNWTGSWKYSGEIQKSTVHTQYQQIYSSVINFFVYLAIFLLTHSVTTNSLMGHDAEYTRLGSSFVLKTQLLEEGSIQWDYDAGDGFHHHQPSYFSIEKRNTGCPRNTGTWTFLSLS